MDEPAPQTAPTRRPALLAGCAAACGCAAWHALQPATGWAAGFAAAALLLLALLLVLRRRLGRAALAACTALALALLFAAWASARALPAQHDLRLQFPDGATLVRIHGTVLEGGGYLRRDPAAFEYPEAPEPQDDFPVGADPRRSRTYIVSAESLPDMAAPAAGCLKLYAPPELELPVGARVELLGRLRRPRRAGNPGEVDSLARYERRGVTHTMTVELPSQATVLEQPATLDPRRAGAAVHDWFHGRLGALMPQSRAALVGAALLGERGGLTSAQRSAFARSGTLHLLVVSGMHVALLAAAIVFVLRLFWPSSRWVWAAAALAALAYLGITGLQPSALRATVMVLIYAMGKLLARRPDPLNVLGGSALVCLLVEPSDIAELGFQLSFLSVLGLLLVGPALRLRRPLSPARLAERRAPAIVRDWVFASLRMSLGVAVCTVPLLAHEVHLVSPVMVLGNLVAGPLVSLLLVLGLFTPLAALPGAGPALAWVLSVLGGAIEAVVQLGADVPLGHFYVAAPPLWWVAGYYAALALVFVLPRLGLPAGAGGVLWLLCLCALPAHAVARSEPPGPARMTSLDVGQGQCVVMEVPGGPCVVLDCGSTSLGACGERVLAPFLWQRNRTRIDVLLLSHADADHVNGLPQVFERFAVGRVLVPATFADDATGRELLRWLSGRAHTSVLQRGDTLELAPGLALRCLWPDPAFVRALLPEPRQRNDGGLVLELAAGPRRVLLPSDVEHGGFAGFAGRYRARGVDVLWAPHQGSAVEGLPDLLSELKPGHVVVSARESFADDDALHSYEQAGARLWTTWRHGAITLELGADGSMAVTPFVP